MKEQTDDMLLSVKESTVTVDSTSTDVKIDDTMVDVVSADVKEDLERETLTPDQVMEDVAVVKEVSDDRVESRVGNSEKVEVVVSEESVEVVKEVSESDCDDKKSGIGSVVGGSKTVMEDVAVVKEKVEVVVTEEVVNEVVRENVATVNGSDGDDQKSGNGTERLGSEVIQENVDCDDQKPGNGPVVGDSKMDSEPLSRELEDVEVSESVVVVADGDDVDNKNGLVVAVEDGLVGKDKAEDDVNNQSSLAEVVDAGMGEDNVDVRTTNTENEDGVEQTNKESFQSTVEATTKGAQKSGNGDSKLAVETHDSTKPGNGPVVGDAKMASEPFREPEDVEVSESVVVVVEEGLVRKDKAEDDVNNQSSLAEVVDGGMGEDNVDVRTTNTEKEDGVEQTNKESFQSTVEATTNGAEKSGNGDSKLAVETHDSTKVPESEDSKMDDENAAEDFDKKAEVDQMSKEENMQSIEVGIDNVPKSEDSKMDDDPQVTSEEIAVKDKTEDLEKGLTKETVDQPTGSVQEVADGDHVTDEKSVKDDALSSSKISHAVTMASLGLEDVDVVVVDEGSEEKHEAQDSVSVELSLVCPVNQSLSTEVVNAGTCEVDQKVEVDSTSKDDTTIVNDEVAVCSKVDEVTTAHTELDSHVQVSTDGGILVENQSMKENDVTDKIQENQDSTVGVPSTGEPQTYGTHGVLPANTEFSYEEAQMDRGEDAGMDIDEVLGWKDEIPSVHEGEQNMDPTNIPNVEKQETELFEHNHVSLKQSHYFHPPECEGEFSVSDLVWGKVRSHPWWPGQIFDPSDASEDAMKYHKKDCFLVAYFGDRTFGWNDSTALKPFREYFSQIERDMHSEDFDKAVHCALVEVSRRVELGLTCSCIPPDIYENIKCQIVENSGIKQESSRIQSLDKSASVNSFEPDKLVDYVRLLATIPHGESDKMELTMAKAQLSSYGRFKGHRQLAEFQLCGDLLEAEQIINETFSEDGSKKRKAVDSISDGLEKRPTLHAETVAAQDPMKAHSFVNPNIGGHHVVVYEHEKPPVKPARRSNKKRFFSSNHEIEANEQSELIKRRQHNLATEVFMKFAEGSYFPSEIQLNKMFRRFGPLLESETEVDRQSGWARVVFKKCSDAEIAHSSAGTFNIFGSVSVHYELNYTPLISYKPLPLPLTQDPPHAS
ncbi:putative non-specific serine/threonine protein kinase [Helianthus anomalus]